MQHGNIFVHCFPCDAFLLSGMNVSLVGEHISDAVWGRDTADVGAQKQHDFLEHCLVCSAVALQNVPQYYRGIDALQCLIASSLVELIFSQDRHSAELEILLEFFLHSHIGCKFVEVQKLLKRQRQHPYLYIPAGEQRGKFRGQQVSIGACDIDVYIKIQTERLDRFFPMLHSL